jgi:polyhydroxybutyrate depolymerase
MRHLTVAGRTFLLSVPRQLQRPAPLVVALGGIGADAPTEVAQYRLGPLAARAGAVVAYPQAQDGLWNAGGCCWGAKGDDVGFLSKMRTKIARLVPLDPHRQVILGFSNGGMLAYFAACADRHWTGIVVLGASLMSRCRPSHLFSITNVNGELDDVAPWNGGWSGYTRTVMPPVWRIDAEFAAVFGCGRARRTRDRGNDIYTYAPCRGGVYVRDIRVPRLWHHWTSKEKDGYDMGPVMWRLGLG